MPFFCTVDFQDSELEINTESRQNEEFTESGSTHDIYLSNTVPSVQQLTR
jgi:hypothetical protein